MSEAQEVWLTPAASGLIPLLLVQWRMSVNHTLYSQVSASGPSPLHAACDNGRIEEVRQLLSQHQHHGVNAKGKFGRTPLHLACAKGHRDIVHYLIEQEADLEIKNNHGFSPLYVASLHNHPSIVKVLVEGGASLSSTDLGGLSPLHIAAEKGNVEALETLLSCGANHSIKDSIGYTPLDWAKLKCHDICIEILRKCWMSDENNVEGCACSRLWICMELGKRLFGDCDVCDVTVTRKVSYVTPRF